MATYTESPLAQALMAIGQQMPQTVRQNKLDEQTAQDRIIKKQLEDLALLKAKQETAETAYKANQRAEGDTANALYQERSRINPVIADLKLGKDPSISPTPYRMDYLERQTPKTNYELAGDYRLPAHAKYSDQASGTMEQLNKEQTAQSAIDKEKREQQFKKSETEQKYLNDKALQDAKYEKDKEQNAANIREQEKKSSLFGGLSGTYANSNDIKGTLINGLTPIPNTLLSKESINKTKTAYDTYLNLDKQIESLRGQYKTHGTELVGDKAEVMKGTVVGIQLALKELENLGVLNGPDLSLMQQMVPDPSGIGGTARGALNPILGDKINPMLDNLKKRIETKVDANFQVNGFKRNNKVEEENKGEDDQESSPSSFDSLWTKHGGK